ncbi:ankyrin repeat domain-containing protein 1-like [Hyalella azteca]|uniref:Ankyrin repeat domain-containing protein 1-like n=1 Tax=Hyalella azteca TaxID=294128 RepID=A0A979FQD7_HYAAZ|nr:ankyrin repeat domain-containing protein 1-like [Hyalella azteca]
MTEQLCEAGADIQAFNVRQDSALHVAASGGHVDVLLCLLDHRANLMARNRYGATPWDAAQESGTANARICADILYTRHCLLHDG